MGGDPGRLEGIPQQSIYNDDVFTRDGSIHVCARCYSRVLDLHALHGAGWAGNAALQHPGHCVATGKVGPDYLGRVFGVLGMISSSMMPLGMLIFGTLADVVKIEWMLMLTGLLMFILGFFLLGSKVLVKAGEPVPAAAKVEE